MSDLQWFILLWGLFIVILAWGSWFYGFCTGLAVRVKQNNLDRIMAEQEIAEFDARLERYIQRTNNFNRADRYYREFQ